MTYYVSSGTLNPTHSLTHFACVNLTWLVGQKKLFHVKEYLAPKDLQEKGLSPILDAMEVADYMQPGVKKRLLRYVWPDSSHTFEQVFSAYLKERGQRCFILVKVKL